MTLGAGGRVVSNVDWTERTLPETVSQCHGDYLNARSCLIDSDRKTRTAPFVTAYVVSVGRDATRSMMLQHCSNVAQNPGYTMTEHPGQFLDELLLE